MKTLSKTTIIGIVTVSAVALTTALVSANGSIDINNIKKNINDGGITTNIGRGINCGIGRGRGRGMGMINNINSEDFELMNEFRNLIHSDNELSQKDFELIKEKQKEFMGFSPFEGFDNVEEFNEIRKNRTGFGMMR